VGISIPFYGTRSKKEPAEADSFFIIVLTITEVMKERPDLPDLPVQA
jgi:hypothetical protein